VSKPTSEPIRILPNVRAISRDEMLAEREEHMAAESREEAPAVAATEEPAEAGIDQETVTTAPAEESQPEERSRNVITKMFDFLFGWMV
jgi:hypothetical protein